MMDIEQRLRRVEHLERIRCLKAHYCDLCDSGYDADALAALFTDDGVWDGGDLGVFEGRSAVRRFFVGMPEIMSFAAHHITNSAIELSTDDQSARGRWYLLQTATLRRGNQAVWLAGRYEDDLVLQGDAWKFRRIKVRTRFLTPYEAGWAAVPMVGSNP